MAEYARLRKFINRLDDIMQENENEDEYTGEYTISIHKKKYSMDEIRTMYGSIDIDETARRKSNYRKIAAAN